MGKASGKKRAKRNLISQDIAGPTWGFDYGISIRSAAIGSFDFNQKLVEADVIAIAYGIAPSVDLGYSIPILSIVGRNESPLRQAFEEFSRWADQTDGDAVDITIVFLKSNGYRLMISPETNALLNRTLKYNAIMDPISFQVSWIKSIDTISVALKQLRRHLEKGIRPFLLSAVTYSGITITDMPVSDFLHPVPNIKPLLKFRIRFADEEDEKEDDFVKMALLQPTQKKLRKKAHKASYSPSPESLLSSRMNRLRTIYPVTLLRVENNAVYRNVCTAAEQFGLRKWQVQQAFCNALVSREIANGLPHFQGISPKDWPSSLVTRLDQRFEIANGRFDISYPVTSEELVRQAILDAGFLLKGLGLKLIPTSLALIQDELRKRDLLDDKTPV